MDRDTIQSLVTRPWTGKPDAGQGEGRLAWQADGDERRDLLLSHGLTPLEKKRRKKWASRRTGEVCQLLVFLFSAKVWWWIGEGIDFLPHHFALGFGWKSHKLGASAFPIPLFLFSCVSSVFWTIRPGRFSGASLFLSLEYYPSLSCRLWIGV